MIELTVKNRIAAIRLANRLERNPEYAKMIGVSVVNGKVENIEEHIESNKEKNNCNRER